MLILRLDSINNGGVCDIHDYTENDLYNGYLVESQAAFDVTLGNCTTIIGTILISDNYTVPFVMNNVTNMTDGLTTYGSAFITPDPSALLTSIQADNLITMEDLYLAGIPGLHNISMAKLEFAGSLTIFSYPTTFLSFPRLKNSTYIQIQGGYSR